MQEKQFGYIIGEQAAAFCSWTYKGVVQIASRCDTIFQDVFQFFPGARAEQLSLKATSAAQKECSDPTPRASRCSVDVTGVPAGMYDTIENIRVTGVKTDGSGDLPQNVHASLVGAGANVRTVRNGRVTGLDMSSFYKVSEEAVPMEEEASFVKSDSDSLLRKKYPQKMDLDDKSVSDEEVLEVLAVRTLLYDTPLSQFTISGGTVLGYMAGYGKLETLQALIQAGADINELDKKGRTPIVRAAVAKNHACMAELLKHGARIDLADKQGRTPLSCAVERDDQVAIEMLKGRGASVSGEPMRTGESQTFEEQHAKPETSQHQTYRSSATVRAVLVEEGARVEKQEGGEACAVKETVNGKSVCYKSFDDYLNAAKN